MTAFDLKRSRSGQVARITATKSSPFTILAGALESGLLAECPRDMVAMMDEMTLRSRARLAIQELEERVTRCQRELENGAYTSALVEARSAKPQMVDLCVLLEMLAQREP